MDPPPWLPPTHAAALQGKEGGLDGDLFSGDGLGKPGSAGRGGSGGGGGGGTKVYAGGASSGKVKVRVSAGGEQGDAEAALRALLCSNLCPLPCAGVSWTCRVPAAAPAWARASSTG